MALRARHTSDALVDSGAARSARGAQGQTNSYDLSHNCDAFARWSRVLRPLLLHLETIFATDGARLRSASAAQPAPAACRLRRDLPCATSDDALPPSVADVTWQELPDGDNVDDGSLGPGGGGGPGGSGGELRLRAVFGGRALRPLSLASVRACLRGRRIAIIGDSLTRYQYLNLAHFLAHGSWYSAPPHLESERQWGSWRNFFRGTSARLNAAAPAAFEVCDCVADPPELRIENRYFTDFSANISLAFRQMRGTLTQRGHDAEWLNAACRAPPCAQTGCEPGDCSGANFTLSAPRELLEHFAATFRPDTIVVNSGFWGGFDAPQTLLDLAAAATAMRAAGVRDLIWKVTTAWMTPEDHSEPGASEHEWLLPTLTRPAATAGAPPAWRVYDTLALTLPLIAAVKAGAIAENVTFWDKFHFQQAVYRGLNEALLLDLIRGCDACAGLGTLSREPLEEQGRRAK